MAILTDSNSQLFRVDGCYALVLAPNTGGRKVIAFAQLADLATELSRRIHTYWYPALQEEVLGVVTPTGKLANVDELVRYGRRLREEAWAGRRYVGYVRRRGPVPGVRCFRGGSSYFRRIATTGERRQGCLVLEDEGEVAPRAKRNHTNLPNSWHDFCRTRERSWKSQHRGRKAWDRLRHGADGGAE